MVSVGILFAMLHRLDASRVWMTIRSGDWRWLIAAVAVTLMFPLLGALRWRTIVSAMGCAIPFGAALRVTLAAFPLNTFLPSKAGDLVKASFLRKHGGFVPLAGSVLLERLIDVLVLTSLSVIGAVWCGQRVILGLAALCALGAGGGILVLMNVGRLPLPGRVKTKAEEIGRAARVTCRHPTAIMLVVLWSVLNWLGTMVESYCLFRAMGVVVPLPTVVAVIPLAIFVGLVPVSLSGIGTRDGALVLLLAGMVQAETVLAVGLLYTAVSYWFLGVLGLPFLWRRETEAGGRPSRPDRVVADIVASADAEHA